MNKKTILGALSMIALTTLWAFAAVPNTLEDVTNGANIRGVVTSSNATGFAKAAYTQEDGYQLHAVISDLTDPKGDDFYEGWVVRNSPFAFISTGELVKEADGTWHNKYSSDIDYSDYDFYVLTLEPNDWNDAPADHIVEGDVTLVESFDAAKKSHSDTIALENVTEGKNIRGVVTSSNASGFAQISYNDDGFKLHAEFSGLTDPKGDDFYEGWLVRQTPFAFISTGELYKKDGKWHNRYSSDIDYSAYDFYVLTLEPNDWDDAPADHILEGKASIVDDVVHPESHNKTGATHDKESTTHAKKQNTELKANLEKAVSKFSNTKKANIKRQVLELQTKLPSLNLSDSKREKYEEIIELLLEVL